MNCTFSIENGCLVRNIAVNGGGNAKSFIRPEDIGLEKPFEKLIDYDKAWLQCKQKPLSSGKNGDIRVVDLFSGCGGLTLGIAEACRALEYNFVPVLAADLAPSALDLYKRNFNPIHTIAEPIEQWINSELGENCQKKRKSLPRWSDKSISLLAAPHVKAIQT